MILRRMAKMFLRFHLHFSAKCTVTFLSSPLGFIEGKRSDFWERTQEERPIFGFTLGGGSPWTSDYLGIRCDDNLN